MATALLLAICLGQFNPHDPELAKLCRIDMKLAKSGNTERRIVHVRDWHFVPADAWEIDLLNQDATLDNEQIDKSYRDFLAQVDAVQAEQRAVFMRLTEAHGVTDVFVEGFTERDDFLMSAMLRNVRSERPNPDIVRGVGAAGKLAAENKLRIVPAESHAVFNDANPTADGTFEFDANAMRKRDEAIVRRLERKSLAVIVLGAKHDLAKHLDDTTELVTLTVPTLAKIERSELLGACPLRPSKSVTFARKLIDHRPTTWKQRIVTRGQLQPARCDREVTVLAALGGVMFGGGLLQNACRCASRAAGHQVTTLGITSVPVELEEWRRMPFQVDLETEVQGCRP